MNDLRILKTIFKYHNGIKNLLKLMDDMSVKKMILLLTTSFKKIIQFQDLGHQLQHVLFPPNSS
jgi:hypothetical protein